MHVFSLFLAGGDDFLEGLVVGDELADEFVVLFVLLQPLFFQLVEIHVL